MTELEDEISKPLNHPTCHYNGLFEYSNMYMMNRYGVDLVALLEILENGKNSIFEVDIPL